MIILIGLKINNMIKNILFERLKLIKVTILFSLNTTLLLESSLTKLDSNYLFSFY